MSLNFLPADDLNPRATIGDNAPPKEDWAELLDTEALVMSLEMDHEKLLNRKAALLKSVAVFNEKHPEGVKTEQDDADATDFGKQLKEFAKLAEETRVTTKRPFFEADKAVQGFFLGRLLDPINAEVRAIESKLSVYKAAKAKREREEREAEARRIAEEAARALALAAETGSGDLIDQAVAAEEQAKKAEKAAIAGEADLSRSRGNFATSSGSTRYSFTVDDLSKVPLEYLMIDESKVKRAINGKNRIKEIPGLTITEEFKATIR